MSKTMLIDATHAEETRVVVLNGSRVEEFDFESHARKQLRGNIYLAKVTRVEPSLQAAFVEYGGNRHGFLAFNEIHPDYYQIPVADREALLAEMAAQVDHRDDEGDDEDEDGDDISDDDHRVRQNLSRRYKIQEVIKRRQIMLVQVVKEERGNKGAALTTYLSLAGRYCVLMPNTARGGGISRKITTSTDRKRLKGVVASLDVPQGMGLIVRTAGAKRTKQEIKRDYDYLLRVWENVRETTLASNAPALIYEEEDLVKRAIRDLFDKDVDQVLVEGDDGYRSAKDFMRMIMPSQAKKIQLYKSNAPLFARYGVESLISKIYSPVVPLKSGGYLVINQTEALVAIDVNSGKSTRERNIEATALKTNMEAAEESARQMRLRDLAGLIVIDFIDMDESKNNRSVEKKLKDALAEDRARIQMGKISGFGLMEISRQRRRTGVLEGTTIVCPHCEGMGRVRSVDSAALSAMRAIDLEAMQNGAGAISVKLPSNVALYILNEKQEHLARLRVEWGLKVIIEIDPDLGQTDLAIVRTVHASEVEFTPPVRIDPVIPEPAFDEADFEEDEDEDEEVEAVESDEAEAEEDSGSEREDRKGGRRRRRRRGGRDRAEAPAATESVAEAEDVDGEEDGEDDDSEDGDYRGRRRRRRGRRGGRRSTSDARPREPYSWVRARTPSLEAPYVWIDPFVEQTRRVESLAPEAPAERTPRKPAITEPGAPLGAPTTQPTSLVPEALQGQPAPRRQRPPRKPRNEAVEVADAPVNEASLAEVSVAEASVTEVAATAIAATAVDTPAPSESLAIGSDVAAPEVQAEEAPKPARRRSRKKDDIKSEAVPAAVVEPVAEIQSAVAAPEPVLELASAEPDPSEISAPPEKPKRGWWRR